MANTTALEAWKDITPLARNESICWVENAKQEDRERRVRGPRRSWRKASADPAAGRGAHTASEPAARKNLPCPPTATRRM